MCQTTDHHVLYAWQFGRECHLQIILRCVQREAKSFPEKIVVMSDGRDAGFGNQLGDRQSQWNMHGDTQDILGNNDVDVELFNEFIKPAFEIVAHGMDVTADL